MADRCEYCTSPCPQAELTREIAKGRMYAMQTIVEMQKELQAYKDAEERGELVSVVRGRWIDKNAGNATCSVCKRRHRDVYDDDASDLFCRSCGAKMEVQDDN